MSVPHLQYQHHARRVTIVRQVPLSRPHVLSALTALHLLRKFYAHLARTVPFHRRPRRRVWLATYVLLRALRLLVRWVRIAPPARPQSRLVLLARIVLLRLRKLRAHLVHTALPVQL
jgi:hypothetical protein